MYRCDYCDGIVEAKCISIQFQWYRHTDHSEPVTIVKTIHFTPERSSLPVFMQLQALCIILWPSINSNCSYSLEMPNFGSNSVIFLSCVTLKFDGSPWNTIGHHFYATSSVVHHFISIGRFKLELQSGNPKFSKKNQQSLSAKCWSFFQL